DALPISKQDGFDAAGPFDRALRADDVLLNLRRGLEAIQPLVAVAMQPNLVPLLDYFAKHLRVRIDLLANDEEGGSLAMRAKQVEHPACCLWVRPIVEGERDTPSPR